MFLLFFFYFYCHAVSLRFLLYNEIQHQTLYKFIVAIVHSSPKVIKILGFE